MALRIVNTNRASNYTDMTICIVTERCIAIKPEPIMLLILPIIPSRNSHNFYPLFLFYSHDITYYSCYILVSVTMRSTVY